jgi:putative ABC transport system permease protein
VGADLWVVEGGRAGPFAETSAVPDSLDRRVEGVSGVVAVRRFIQFNRQFDINGRSLRMAVTGIDFPNDTGSWIPLDAGVHLQSAHYEAIADRSTGLLIGDVIRLGHDDYTIVGISRGQVDMAGDGLLFVTIPDAQAINRVLPSEAILLNRQAEGRSRMGLGETSGSIAAVIVQVSPYAEVAGVKAAIQRWGDVEVLTKSDQEDLLMEGRLRKLRIQILAFTAMTLLVCGSVIALTIYTMTLEKIPQIGLLRLMGARDRVIVGLIAQEACLTGAFGLAVALGLSYLVYPTFPRTVLLEYHDLAGIGGLLMLMSLLASWFGIRRALAVRAQEVLS